MDNPHSPQTARFSLGSLLPALLLTAVVHAQHNEFTFFAGGGRASGEDASSSGSIIGIGYSRWFGARWTLELGHETLRTDSVSSWDTASVASAYHFVDRPDSKWSPFASFGVGGLFDDFTELDTHFLVRTGGGIRFFPSTRLAIRVEAFHDFVHSRHSRRAPAMGDWIGVTSLRAGVSLRF